MSIDMSPLGELTARVMDMIGENFGDDFTVRTAAVVVEVDSEKSGRLLALCSDDRPWVFEKFLDEAIDSIIAMRSSPATEED